MYVCMHASIHVCKFNINSVSPGAVSTKLGKRITLSDYLRTL